MESLAGQRRRYHAVARGDVSALALEADALLDVFEDNFEMALEFLSGIAQRALDFAERLGSKDELLRLLVDARDEEQSEQS